MAFLGPLTSGLVFFVDGFGAPLRPLRPAFWFLLRAVRSFCSCSLCSHLCGNAEDKEAELGKDIIINNYVLIKAMLNQRYQCCFNGFVLYSAEPSMSVCYSCLQGEPAMWSWVGEFPRYQQMAMTTAHLVCMLHVSVHLTPFQKVRGAGTMPSKRQGLRTGTPLQSPSLLSYRTCYLTFPQKSLQKADYPFIYLNTQLQGKVVFTFCFCYSLGWRALGMKELMLWTDNGDDH